MIPIETCRCPSCGVLNAVGQAICLRCLGDLPLTRPTTPVVPMTSETCSLYRAHTSDALLLLSSVGIEYSATGIALSASWNIIDSIVDKGYEAYLWLHHTPPDISLALSSSKTWFSDITRAIPLKQFGYPTNRDLCMDLGRYGPHLRRTLPKKRYPRD